MKKTVIATVIAAALSTPLLASAQVALSGKVGMWTDSTKVGDTTTNSLVVEPTSNLAVVASERVGKVTARATVETSLRGNTMGGSSTQFGDRQFTAGLSTPFGSVDFGRNVHSHFLAITGADAFSTLYGSVAGDVHNLRDLRIGDGVYVAATPLKGVTATFDRSVGGDTMAFGVGTQFMGVKVNAARWDGGKDVSDVLALQAKVAGFGVSWIHSADTTSGVKTVGDSFGLTRTLGRATLKGTYGRTDRDLTAYALGADYALSKRTEVGVSFRKVDRAGSAGDVQGVGVGLTHRF